MQKLIRQNFIEGTKKKKKDNFDAKDDDDDEPLVIGSFKQEEVDGKNLNRMYKQCHKC